MQRETNEPFNQFDPDPDYSKSEIESTNSEINTGALPAAGLSAHTLAGLRPQACIRFYP
ncbi:hypothetical protein ACFJIV_01005 [Mucilaginibacter sp. UC70_90]